MNTYVRNVRRVISAFTVLGIAVLFTDIVWQRVEAASPKANPHEQQGEATNELCTTCHRETPQQFPERPTRTVLPDPDRFVIDAVEMCISCHDEEKTESSHPVGAQPGYPVPADLPLGKDGTITCLTCHYTHGKITSDHQCASASLLDRWFNRKRLHKSYLLRRDNPHGELCKACHETTAQMKEE